MRLGVAAALYGALLLSGAPAAGQETAGSHVTEALDLRPGETLLEVSAEGVSRDRPTILTISTGVVSVGPTAIEALEANSVEMNAVIDAVRSLGIEAHDIQTSDLRVEPQFAEQPDDYDSYRNPEPPRIIGYIARNTVELRLRSLDRASGIIGALFEAGANDVNGPNFDLDDETRPAALEAARADAVANAQTQAESYARAFGMRIARVIRVSERSSRSGGGERIIVTATRITGTPVEPGEIETEVRLWLDYALVPR